MSNNDTVWKNYEGLLSRKPVRMRTAFYGLVIVLAAGVNNTKAAEAERPNCALEIVLPRYSFASWGARLQGTVKATFSISSEGHGKVQQVTAPHPLLELLVVEAVSKSKGSADCTKQFTFSFEFVVAGEPAAIAQQEVRFVPPDKFKIVTTPPAPFNN